MLIYRFVTPIAGTIVMTLSTLLGLTAAASPARFYPALVRFVRRTGTFVGLAFSWLLLVPFFYLIVTPLGLVFKRGRRDPLQRRLEPHRDSYWQRPESDWSETDLRRQF